MKTAKREVGKLKMEGMVINEERAIFYFLKPLKFIFWVYKIGNFPPGEKIRKMTLPPLKNIPLTPLH